MDEIQINYRHHAGNAPNHCLAETTYKGKPVGAYGKTWNEARQNLINLCKQAKATGQPPESESFDLDPALIQEKPPVDEATGEPIGGKPSDKQKLEPIGTV